MSKHKYYPDYAALYPGVEISPKVLKALRQSDRKMKYLEYDLKCEQFIAEGDAVCFLPSREDSLERLLENGARFRGDAPSAEELLTEAAYIQELYSSLDSLDADERALIDALFFEGRTEREYGITIGLSQTGVSWRKRAILDKLKNFLCD